MLASSRTGNHHHHHHHLYRSTSTGTAKPGVASGDGGGGKRPAAVRCRVCFRKLFAFILSKVGLCVLVVAYSICGAFMFRAIESQREMEIMKQTERDVRQLRNDTVFRLWQITYNASVLFQDGSQWESSMTDEIKAFQVELMKSIKAGYKGTWSTDSEKWSFSGAFLFSLTVISTIGYGNISPRTDKGKLMTILYAIVGIPLMLLYLTNIGDILAKSFRYVYGLMMSCKQNPTSSSHQRNKTKLAQLQQQQQQQQQQSKQQAKANSAAAAAATTNQTSKHADAMETSSSSNYYDNQVIKYQQQQVPANSGGGRIHVPITLCLLILASYVCGGGLLFTIWEGWNYLDGSYFCFISLSTIGFGDLVPGVSEGSQVKLVICSFYLLAGMAVLAMCFNLMQEEVVHRIRQLAKRLGIVNDPADSEHC